jgi:hypothetical protein
MHIRDQKRTIDLGRKTMNNAEVTKTSKARASSRRSVQCVREVESPNWKESGKTVGNPREVRPCDVNGTKSVKLPVRERLPHPPLLLEIIPLTEAEPEKDQSAHTRTGRIIKALTLVLPLHR